jgi:hypothetical protein
MSLDQEHRLEEIFIAARDLPPQERTVFPDGACGALQDCTGKPIRCLPRMSKGSSLINIGQNCGNL